jgi:DNA-binding NtrC family response regulator
MAISLPMRLALEQVIEAASVDAPVLITGETGTGKDMVAAAIHKRSKRQHRPYVPVNMGAISHELIGSELFGHMKGAFTGAADSHLGVFEQAQGGSIFLDEITTMDEKTQISLLRVLETKTIRRVGGSKDIDVDARVIAATNENIEETVKARRFREDLYYRLDVFRVHLPPLRERPGDVTFLTNHFISRFGALYKKSIRRAPAEIYQILRAYAWPGNVRELKNVIQRAVVMAKGAELTADLLPLRITGGANSRPRDNAGWPTIYLGMSLEQVEKEFIMTTLASVAGNKAKAATILRISRHTLYDKLKKYGVL